jgi:hypothetical protein
VVFALERQQLAQGGLVHLHDADAGGLEIRDLVAQRERNLARRLAEWLVIAHERPGEDRHGARQHALDRLGGQALRIP